jgi:cell division protein FtsQ
MPDPAMGPLAAERERTRRMFARRQWLRRWDMWRWGVGLSVVAAVVLLLGWLVLLSGFLGVRSVSVSGTDVLGREEVIRAAAVERGMPLARVDLAVVGDRVEALTPVASAEVTRSWPRGIRIRIVERTAVAVVKSGDVLRGMDATGVLFRSYRRPPGDLPVVRTTGDVDSRARVEAAEVTAALPRSLARRVENVEVRTVDQITLRLRDGRLVRWGSAEQSALKAEVLAALLGQDAQEYDVSVPGQATTRG